MQAGQAVGAFGDSSMTVESTGGPNYGICLLLLFGRENRLFVLSQAAIEDSVDEAEGIRPNCRDAKTDDLKTDDLKTGVLKTGL
jgi:hypothetical protein